MGAAVVSALGVGVVDLDVTPADIERAQMIGRDRESERARFHKPYIVSLNDATVTSVEVITEFRRYVLVTEDHIRRGLHSFAYSARSAQEAVAPWHRRLSVLVRLRFHPLNTYFDIPAVELTLLGASGELRPTGMLRDQLYTPTALPGQAAPVLGAIIEAVFDAELVGQSRRTAIIRMEGKELTRVEFDFGAID
jgi:hypothetical protein